jgi:type IV secretory pathway TraG/TraD family ATPase VirD4
VRAICTTAFRDCVTHIYLVAKPLDIIEPKAESLPQLMQVGRGFKEEVTSAPNTTITLRTRDEETAEYFIKASAEQVVTRRSVQKERGFFGFGKYEETGRATESENRETRSQDESIKNLPKGQMEILMSDALRVANR